MEITKSKKNQAKLTDFQTFWKIITLVCISIIAEALIIWAATSDLAVDWTYDTVIATRHDTAVEAEEMMMDEEVMDEKAEEAMVKDEMMEDSAMEDEVK